MNEPIVITGAGILCAIGNNKAEVFDSLNNKRTGVAPLQYLPTEHKEFPVGEVKMSNAEMAKCLGVSEPVSASRTALMGIWAMQEALADAQLNTPDARQGMAFISGTTVGGMDVTEQKYSDYIGEGHLDNGYIRLHDCGGNTEAIADYYKGFSYVTTLSTACSSAANAIIMGANLIKAGLYDKVIVGGSESLSKFHLNGFNSLMILDHEICRPFDESRAGLNLGEGAAYLVLETETSARKRGVMPIGLLSGYGNACDAFHQTASSDNGEGAYLAMSKALASAGLQPQDIQYVNMHGTGTPNNDITESIAMKRIFGDCQPACSSTKAFTGHTTSACGSIESVVCLLAILHKLMPVSLNCKRPIAEGIIPLSDNKPCSVLKHTLCNSFGFGGNDSSLVLSEYTAS